MAYIDKRGVEFSDDGQTASSETSLSKATPLMTKSVGSSWQTCGSWFRL